MKEFFKTIVALILIAIPVAIGGMVVIGGGDGIWQHERMLLVPATTFDVFELLTIPAKRTEWVGGLEQSRVLDAGVVKVGTRYREVYDFEGERREFTVTVTEAEPERLLVLEFEDGLDDGAQAPDLTLRYVLSAGGSIRKTRIRFTCEGRLQGWINKLSEPIPAGRERARIDADFESLVQIAPRFATL